MALVGVHDDDDDEDDNDEVASTVVTLWDEIHPGTGRFLDDWAISYYHTMHKVMAIEQQILQEFSEISILLP